MKPKVYVKTVILSVCAVLFLVACFNYYADPFFFYHLPNYQMSYLAVGYPVYQNNGAAKTFSYDSAIIGTSTSTGFDPAWFDAAFQANTIQLTVSGSCPYDNIYLMNNIFSSGNSIRNIFYGFDVFHLQTFVDTTHFNYSQFLTSSRLFNDVSYLFNSEILLKYSVNEKFISSEQNLKDYNAAFLETYLPTTDEKSYGQDVILSHYTRQNTRALSSEAGNILKMSEENALNIVEIAKEQPNTQFYIYIMPVNMYYWDSINQKEEIDYFMQGLSTFFKIMLENNNIHLYCFLDNIDLSTDYSLYRDYVHHSPMLDEKIVNMISEGEGLVTTDNYQGRIDNFKQYLQQFNFDALFRS